MTSRATTIFSGLVLAVLAFAGCGDAASEGTATACRDGADNDGDGHTDCDDQDCGLFVFCGGADDAGPTADGEEPGDASVADDGGPRPVADVQQPGQDVAGAVDAPAPSDVPTAPDLAASDVPPLDVSVVPDVCEGDCGERVCGTDGCGRSCGRCADDERCTAAGQCVPNDGPRLGVQPTVVDFGARPVGTAARIELRLTAVGGPVRLESVALTNATSAEFGLAEPVAATTLEDGEALTVVVEYTPADPSQMGAGGAPVLDEGVLVVANDTAEPSIEVPLRGYGVDGSCPVAVVTVDEGPEVLPLTLLHLHGGDSTAPGHAVQRWEWTVTQPAGGVEVLRPSSRDPNPTFAATLAGHYEFALAVWDETGRMSCNVARYEVAVVPDEAIYVELLWRTPGDPDETDQGTYAGSDMDVHLLHPNAPGPEHTTAQDCDGDGVFDPYFDPQYDCFWLNPHPNWGLADTTTDDPQFLRDDLDGGGPESLALNVAETGAAYEVAVHYWDDHGFGNAFATLRIHVFQTLAFERTERELTSRDIWSAAFVDWPSGEVRAVTTMGGGDRILPDCMPEGF